MGTAARTWVGLWPPPEVVHSLQALSRVEHPDVRWMRPDQWHVTLRFLGLTEPAEVTAALTPLRHPPVHVTVGPRAARLGRSVLMVPVSGLESLAQAVGDLLAPLAGAPSTPFLGHLTLARLKQSPACRLIDDPISAAWIADRVAVVTSDLRPEGARYHTVAELPLSLSLEGFTRGMDG